MRARTVAAVLILFVVFFGDGLAVGRGWTAVASALSTVAIVAILGVIVASRSE